MIQIQPRALSIRAAAQTLGVSEGTIKNRLRDGSLKGARLGRRVLIPTSEITRLVGEEVANVEGGRSERR